MRYAELWVAGRWSFPEPWEIIGIYDTESKAVARCTCANDFVGPMTLNKDEPEFPVEWEGQYYPLTECR